MESSILIFPRLLFSNQGNKFQCIFNLKYREYIQKILYMDRIWLKLEFFLWK